MCVRNINIKGYAVLYANDSYTRRAFVSMLGVRPEFQRQNCGKYLLAACEEFSRWKGMKTLALEVSRKNINGMEFYRHLGFREEEQRENSYIYSKNIL